MELHDARAAARGGPPQPATAEITAAGVEALENFFEEWTCGEYRLADRLAALVAAGSEGWEP
jgi:hypothetical protein